MPSCPVRSPRSDRGDAKRGKKDGRGAREKETEKEKESERARAREIEREREEREGKRKTNERTDDRSIGCADFASRTWRAMERSRDCDNANRATRHCRRPFSGTRATIVRRVAILSEYSHTGNAAGAVRTLGNRASTRRRRRAAVSTRSVGLPSTRPPARDEKRGARRPSPTARRSADGRASRDPLRCDRGDRR